MDLRRRPEVDRSSEDGDFPADVPDREARADGGHQIPRPIAGRDDDPPRSQESRAADLESRDSPRLGRD